MRGIAASLLAFAMTVAAAQAETIKLRCTVETTPKSEAEDYVVDTDDNSVTVVLHDVHGKALASKTYPATISSKTIEWQVDTAGDVRWRQRYDRATNVLISSNTNGDSLKETCRTAS